MPTKHEAALLYTSWGWVVHPLHPAHAKVNSPGKQPVLEKWQTRKKATDKELRDWFIENDYNIGLVCGKTSGVMVIDFDKKDFMRLLFQEDVETMISQRTKGRGHVYLKYDPDFNAFKNTELGIELLTNGSNAVMPPSLHPEGQIYTFNRIDGNVAVITEWQKKILAAIARYKESKAELRTCFRWMIDNEKSWHGADGRRRMLALAADLKAHGCGENDCLVFANRIYQGDLSIRDTLAEWKNVDANKTWKCETLRTEFPDIKHLCSTCQFKPGKPDKIKTINIVDHIMKKYTFITVAETDEVYYYNEGVFHPLGNVRIKSEVQSMIDGLTTHTVNEVINTIKRMTYINLSEINKNPMYLPLENGILNLDTFEMGNYDPAFLLTTRIPVIYDPAATCPAVERFFSEVVGGKEDVEALHEFFGYCLLRSYYIQKAFMLVGGGGNGKSTLLDLLRRFLGAENVTSIPLQELEENRFATANLFGKLANTYADLPPRALSSTGKIKMLTGGDLLTAEKKFGGFISFVNYAKMIFSTNQMPLSYDDSDAFYRRWVIINFPNQFDEVMGKGLIDRLTTRDELSGLLNLALDGLKRLLRAGRFSNQLSVDEVRESYVRMSDSIQAFLWDCIESSPESYIEKKQLYTFYGKYCKTCNIPISSEKRFFTRLPILTRVEEIRPEINGKRVSAYSGIVFKISLIDLDTVTTMSRMSRVKSYCGKQQGESIEERELRAQESETLDTPAIPANSTNSVTASEQAVRVLKDKYDSFRKPDTIQDMERLRSTMVATLLLEGIDDGERYADGYLHARGWQ